MSLGALNLTLAEPQRAAANIKRIAVEAKHCRYHRTTHERRGVRRQCWALFSADWRFSSGKLHYSIRTKHQPYSNVATRFPTC